MFSKLNNNAAFTLIETIVVMTIVGIISAVTFEFVARSADISRIAATQDAVYEDIVYALERMSREIQNCEISDVQNPATLVITDSKKTSCGKCVDKSTNITYSWVGGKLYRTGNISGRHVLADDITMFGVSQSGEVVTINITKSLDGYDISLKTSIHPNMDFEEVIL
ncbi:MAG: hypothetical protein IEMM0002_0874 [bacterium]|nr:MAG: hypothetical protein IEMM0002_0874 [bacterium]